MKELTGSIFLFLCLNLRAQIHLSSDHWTMFVVINDSTKEIAKSETVNYFLINKDWSMCSQVTTEKRFDYLINEKITQADKDIKLLLKAPDNSEYMLYLSLDKSMAVFIFEDEGESFMIRYENLKVID